MKRQLLTLCLTLATAGAFAQHAEKCDPIPKDEWKPQAELERKLTNEGWTIQPREDRERLLRGLRQGRAGTQCRALLPSEDAGPGHGAEVSGLP